MLFSCSQTPTQETTSQNTEPKVYTADIIVYGGTSGAVTAAVQAKKMGKSVIMVSPDIHLGGLSAGGLGFTDTGNKNQYTLCLLQ